MTRIYKNSTKELSTDLSNTTNKMVGKISFPKHFNGNCYLIGKCYLARNGQLKCSCKFYTTAPWFSRTVRRAITSVWRRRRHART